MPPNNDFMREYLEDLHRADWKRDRRRLLVKIAEQAGDLERSLQDYGTNEAREEFRKAGDISCWAEMRLEELND